MVRWSCVRRTNKKRAHLTNPTTEIPALCTFCTYQQLNAKTSRQLILAAKSRKWSLSFQVLYGFSWPFRTLKPWSPASLSKTKTIIPSKILVQVQGRKGHQSVSALADHVTTTTHLTQQTGLPTLLRPTIWQVNENLSNSFLTRNTNAEIHAAETCALGCVLWEGRKNTRWKFKPIQTQRVKESLNGGPPVQLYSCLLLKLDCLTVLAKRQIGGKRWNNRI